MIYKPKKFKKVLSLKRSLTSPDQRERKSQIKSNQREREWLGSSGPGARAALGHVGLGRASLGLIFSGFFFLLRPFFFFFLLLALTYFLLVLLCCYIWAYKSSIRDSISMWIPRGKSVNSDPIKTLKLSLKCSIYRPKI